MEEIIKQIQPILTSLLLAAMTWGAAELTRWIKQKTKSARATEAVDTLSKAVIESVKEIEQTMRPHLGDGLSSSNKLKLKSAVIASVKNKVTPKMIELAKRNLNDVDAWMSSKIEATVLDLKSSKPAV